MLAIRLLISGWVVYSFMYVPFKNEFPEGVEKMPRDLAIAFYGAFIFVALIMALLSRILI